MNRKELSEYADVGERLLDNWCRRGWIKPDKIPRPNGEKGAQIRDWSQEEADVALWMGRLKDIGFHTEVVSGIARKIVAARNGKLWSQDPIWIQLNQHFVLEVN